MTSTTQRYAEPKFDGEWSLVCTSDEQCCAKEPPQRKRRASCLKGVRFSPDGTCALTASEDRRLCLFVVPAELYDPDAQLEGPWPLVPELCVTEGEIIYDFRWFPLMRAGDPATSCFVSASCDHPVHLWDAYTGVLRANYLPHNHLEELVAPLSVAFSPDGARLHCGFDSCIRTFDVGRPGRQCSVLATRQRGGSPASLAGLIGSLCPSPDGRLLAAGSYSRRTALYSTVDCSCVCMLAGHVGGVTQVAFSPGGNLLATGARKDPSLFVWDLRNTAKGPLHNLQRVVLNNQRVAFDFTPSGSCIVSGSQNNSVLVFSASTGALIRTLDDRYHSDAVNGVSVHPALPLIATTTGQRKIIPLDTATSDDDDDEETSTTKAPQLSEHGEAKLRIWKVPHEWRVV
jgi:WD40 repeat protein